MGMFRKIVAWSILFVGLQHVARITYHLGYLKTIYNHIPGPCKLVEGVEFGSEDIATLPDGKAFITSGFLVSTASQSLKDHHIQHNVKGKIFLFDFNQPDQGVADLEIRGDINVTGFRPHGLDYWINEKTGQVYLFVVNHEDDRHDTVEKFEYKGTYLLHIKKYRDEGMAWVNDVAATGENSFYFSNTVRFNSKMMKALQMLLMVPLGNVIYYDGDRYSTEVESLLGANGLALTSDKRNLFVATILDGEIKIYDRQPTPTQGHLSFVESVKVATGVDNPTISHHTGSLLVGAHPAMYRLLIYMDDPTIPTPSQVLMMKIKDGRLTNITELYSEDGHTLYGSSVASLYNNKMLIGTVLHKLMFCEVNIL